MKHIQSLISVFILLITLSCNDEPLEGDFVTENPTNCAETTQALATAALDFINVSDENYTTLCNAYKVALQNQIAACGDEDNSLQTILDSLGNCNDEEPDDNVEVVGTWLLTAWNGEEGADLNNDGTSSTNFLDEMDCYNNETFVFNADNTGTAMSTSFATFTFEIETGTTDSYTYTVECDQEIENNDFTWTQTGNVITITDTATSQASDWTLNGNELSTVVPSGFVAFDSEDITVTVTQDLTFVYTKQ
ncbi:hypothetical protein [Lacinutrix salivirga]